MDDRTDSKQWTGDYDKRGHVLLTNAADRARTLKIVRYALFGSALFILVALGLQVLT